jgi:hypothetical protein
MAVTTSAIGLSGKSIDDDLGACAGKRETDGFGDPGTATGHNRDPLIELSLHTQLLALRDRRPRRSLTVAVDPQYHPSQRVFSI